jgi:carbamoyltransferase
VVHAGEDPAWHRLLGLVGEATGVPVLAVQSLNPAGQPVACTPGDTVRIWRDSGLARLFLGPYEVGR